MVAAAVRVTLPGGRWLDGERDTTAFVRPLTVADEVALLDDLQELPRPAAATELLRRAVGFPDRPDPDVFGALAVGDREALLWHVRGVTAGALIDATVSCATCQAKASVTLAVSDLLHSRYPRWSPTFFEHVAGHDVEFRLPTGDDQLWLVREGVSSPTEAAEALLRTCVVAIDGEPARPSPLTQVAEGVSEHMAVLDPQAEALLSTICPDCGAAVQATLDATAFLSEEIVRRGRAVLADVHVLASAYGWSEPDVLALSPARRQLYLDLIEADRVAQGNR